MSVGCFNWQKNLKPETWELLDESRGNTKTVPNETEASNLGGNNYFARALESKCEVFEINLDSQARDVHKTKNQGKSSWVLNEKPKKRAGENLNSHQFHDSRYYSTPTSRLATFDRRQGVTKRAAERIRLDEEWRDRFDRPGTGRKIARGNEQIEGIETTVVDERSDASTESAAPLRRRSCSSSRMMRRPCLRRIQRESRGDRGPKGPRDPPGRTTSWCSRIKAVC